MNQPSPTLAEIQELIRKMYGWKDEKRGAEGTFLWLSEEIGELAAALREEDHPALEREFADVLAWLATLANVKGVDLGEAIRRKYGGGCPGCGQLVCDCGPNVKP
jgi:NTP pyrophosphatase (non-canonical NTP hydrolase)